MTLPSGVPTVFFWAALVVCVTTILGVFRPLVVLPVLGVVVALTWRLTPDPVPATRAHRVGALWALALVAAWTLVNLVWAGEILLVQRDPGFLTLEGVWLTTHSDPAIPIRSAAEVADQVTGVRVISDAFWLFGDELPSCSVTTCTSGARPAFSICTLTPWSLARSLKL